jgi:hypothetical protein
VVALIGGCASSEEAVAPSVSSKPSSTKVFAVQTIEQVNRDEQFELVNSDGTVEEIIYSGKEGDVIELQYRTFSREPEAPYLYRKIRHDLKESLEFELGGAKFEVVEASGYFLRFKLVKN